MNAPSFADTLAQADALFLEVKCSARLVMLAPLRRLVGAVAEELGFAGEDLIKIEMAVDEACTNAFLHGRSGDPGDDEPEKESKVGLKMSASPQCLTIEVSNRDSGQVAPWRGAVTMADYALLGRDDYKGLGTLIMRQFMDEARVATAEGRTRVTLRKRLPSRPDGA
jgi:serine/threonine-protein kinase RsbW